MGGIILAKAESQEKIQKIIAEDPFFIHEAASYDIIEFIPTKSANGLAAFISWDSFHIICVDNGWKTAV